METTRCPEIPEEWDSCSIKMANKNRAIFIGDFLTTQYDLTLSVTTDDSVKLSAMEDQDGKKIRPPRNCNKALQKLMDDGAEITFE